MTKEDFVAKVSVDINSPVSKVWDALVNPEVIKKYLFGTEAISDWKIGSSIIYRGQWQGKTYEDKGVILNIVPEKLFQSTYWSAGFGLPDTPENYKKVTYELTPEGNSTKLTLTQENNSTQETKEHLEENWKMVLANLKKVLES